jgi:EpsI family protein
MIVTLVVLFRRGDSDRVPSSALLDQFPRTIGDLGSTDVPIPQEALDLLGKGFFLNRTYSRDTAGGDPQQVGLFIGYFPTQRSGQSIHSPQNCLPGSGWVFETSGVTRLTGLNGKQDEVGDYIISNGPSRAEVLYWYQSHGRTIASDYKAKLYMLTDSIRYDRSDAALVRVVVPLFKDESPAQAHTRAVAFASQLLPLLPAYIPD